MATERNLLFGVLAVQLKLATPRQLVQAGAVWAAEQEQSLGAILVEQGVLDEKQHAAIQGLLDVQLEAHGGDEAAALETFGGGAAVHESFAASVVYDAQTGMEYKSLGGETPRLDADEPRSLSDKAQLTTEHPGRYTIKGEQGRGGVGRVLIAYDEHIGREIALKELLPDAAATITPAAESPMRQSATLTARFLREARITGQLEHPGIVPVYEVGQRSDGATYYTMKLVRGETLADRLKRCRGIGDRLKLLPHYLDLCQAIAYAHSRGVIHRDIKPGNVMIGEFGETVLLDWGLAKVKGQKDEGATKIADEIRLLKAAGAAETVAGKPIGTPSYMPPEQADGRIEDIDERSDVWSLGAVLYEILTGQPPYTGSTAFEVIGKVLSDDPVPVLEAQKDAPGELAAVAMRCLQKQHQQRYASVEQITEDVNAYLSGGLVNAYTYSTGLLMRRWVRKYKPTIWVASISLIVLICLLAFVYIGILNEKRLTELALTDSQISLRVLQKQKWKYYKLDQLADDLYNESGEEIQFYRDYSLVMRWFEVHNTNLQSVAYTICKDDDKYDADFIQDALNRLENNTRLHHGEIESIEDQWSSMVSSMISNLDKHNCRYELIVENVSDENLAKQLLDSIENRFCVEGIAREYGSKYYLYFTFYSEVVSPKEFYNYLTDSGHSVMWVKKLE